MYIDEIGSIMVSNNSNKEYVLVSSYSQRGCAVVMSKANFIASIGFLPNPSDMLHIPVNMLAPTGERVNVDEHRKNKRNIKEHWVK